VNRPLSTAPQQPVRLFLDSGVILEGCFGAWGASKAVLILATLRANFTVVLAEAIEREVQRALARKTAFLDAATASAIAQGVSGWLDRVRIERYPLPSEDDIRAQLPSVLPALRHINDLPAVVTALQARPDWVISTNTEHWNQRLAERTRLRIATPQAFLLHLRP
jgi:hypothetical protein